MYSVQDSKHDVLLMSYNVHCTMYKTRRTFYDDFFLQHMYPLLKYIYSFKGNTLKRNIHHVYEYLHGLDDLLVLY